MKPAGPAHERETIIRFSDEDDSVQIWTASGAIYRKLTRLGFECVYDGERHADFRCSKRNLTIRRLAQPRPPLSEVERARRAKNLIEARERRRQPRFTSTTGSIEGKVPLR